MNYKLNVTTNKSGKFHYTVTDENGNVISERKSNREYVACTTNGSHYFGRLDLIGKGDHGSHLNRLRSYLSMSKSQYYLSKPDWAKPVEGDYEQMQSDAKKSYELLNSIAYK